MEGHWYQVTQVRLERNDWPPQYLEIQPSDIAAVLESCLLINAETRYRCWVEWREYAITPDR